MGKSTNSDHTEPGGSSTRSKHSTGNREVGIEISQDYELQEKLQCTISRKSGTRV